MAKCTGTDQVAAVSGQIGGVIYERSGRGQVVRGLTYHRTNPLSRSRLVAARLGSLAQQWRQLTEADRQAWSGYAATSTPRGDRFGRHELSGFQAYISYNAQLLDAAIPILTRPPRLGVQPVLSLTSSVHSVNPIRLRVTIPTAVDAFSVKMLYASRPISPGISNLNGLPTRLLIKTTSNAEINCDALYAALYGSVGPTYAGYLILLRAIAVGTRSAVGPESTLLVALT